MSEQTKSDYCGSRKRWPDGEEVGCEKPAGHAGHHVRMFGGFGIVQWSDDEPQQQPIAPVEA